MEPEENIAKLRQVIEQVTDQGVEDIALDMDLVQALALDSLTGLRVMAATEKHFQVRFRDEELKRLRTMRQLLAAIEIYQQTYKQACKQDGEERCVSD